MFFKFFPNTQTAEKFARSKKCKQRKIDEFQSQYNVIHELQSGLTELQNAYRKNFEKDKAMAIGKCKGVLAQVNGIIKELIEEHQDLRKGEKINRAMRGSKYYIKEVIK